MTYTLLYSSKSEAQLKKLDKKTKIQIVKKVSELKKNSELGKPLRNIFKNYRSLHIGKYRVIYTIKGKNIIITKVGYRKQIY